jgi:membrane-associated phospholipid phosphatase
MSVIKSAPSIHILPSYPLLIAAGILLDLVYNYESIRIFDKIEPLLKFLSFLGLGGTQVVLLALLLLMSYAFSKGSVLQGRVKRLIFTGIAAVAFSGLLVQAIKHMVGRPRPRLRDLWGIAGPTFAGGFDSFPSGHSTTSFALASVAAFYFPHMRLPVFVAAAAIAVSRILLGSHFPGDVAGGIILGIIAGKLAVRWSEEYLKKRYGVCMETAKGPGKKDPTA